MSQDETTRKCAHRQVEGIKGGDPMGMVWCLGCQSYIGIWQAFNALLVRLQEKERQLEQLLVEKGGDDQP